MGNTLGYLSQSIFFFILRFFYFPFWWYSYGFFEFAKNNVSLILRYEEKLALFAWVQSIFKPLFNSYSALAMFYSFWIRLAQIIARSALFVLFCLFVVIKMIAWILLPVIVVYYLSLNL